MDFLEFIERTRHMTPQQRSEFFNSLSEDEQNHLIENGGEIQLIMIAARMVIGAEMIENEPNVFKREKMMKTYDSLSEEYLQLRTGGIT